MEARGTHANVNIIVMERKNRGEKILKNSNDRIKERKRFILEALMECQTEYMTKTILNIIILKNSKEKVKKISKLTERKRSCAKITFRLKSYFSIAKLN